MWKVLNVACCKMPRAPSIVIEKCLQNVLFFALAGKCVRAPAKRLATVGSKVMEWC